MADTLNTADATGGTYKELATVCRKEAQHCYDQGFDTQAQLYELRGASFEICHVLYEIGKTLSYQVRS